MYGVEKYCKIRNTEKDNTCKAKTSKAYERCKINRDFSQKINKCAQKIWN